MFSFIRKIFGIAPPTDFGVLMGEGAVIVDVRTKGEYASGHIKGSLNIPLDSLRGNHARLDKSRPVITCCASGMRSASARALLRSNGFSRVYNGGGWQSLKNKLK